MRLSLPSLDQVGAALLKMYKRFPFVLFVSVVGTVAAIWLAELPYDEQDNYPRILSLAFCSGLGISFLFGLATFLEQKKWSTLATYGIQFGGLALIALYWVLLGDQMIEGPYEIWYRFFLFALASHLFAAFAPFVGSGNVDQFWEYNKTLFLRILLSVLYSGVLFVGLSVALLALDNLLDLNIDGESYFQLFLFLGGIFNTWFFLTGVPERETIQKKETTFPTGLRVFVQYVLIPLVTVYIVILYLYLGKIILEWELPNGWVSNLVLTFSIAGILSLLLLYPIRESKEYNWIRIYSKGYYLALIPLIGLLMFSIWVRISEYGVTINRYYVATLGVWLTGVVAYFIFSKVKSIKVIPISLCLIALGISFGPLGAFAVSEQSQSGRFEEILSKNGLLNEQRMAIPKREGELVSFNERKQLSSLVGYLLENHGISHLQDYFEQDLSTLLDSTSDGSVNSRFNASKIIGLLDLQYVEDWQLEETGDFNNPYFEFTYSSDRAINIQEYDFSATGLQFYVGTTERTFSHDNTKWKLIKNEDKKLFNLVQDDSEYSIEISYQDFQENLLDKYSLMSDQVPFQDMHVVSENGNVKVLSVFSFFSGNLSDGGSLSSVKLNLYIKEKQ